MYPLEGKSWFWPLVNTRLPPGFTQSVHLMGSRVSPNPNPRWFVLHPDMWNKEGQLAWRWHPAECGKGSNSRQEAGSQLGGEKNRTFAGSVYREGGPPASKDYTIALV